MEWRLIFLTRSLLMLMLMLALTSNPVEAQQVFSIKDFGAVGDEKTDNSKALSDAWKEACHSNGTSVVLIPSGTYLLGPVLLTGPCNGAIQFQIEGGLKAYNSPQLGIDHWITFKYVDWLTISGGGVLDGQGSASWPYNDCSKVPKCKALPVTMRFDFVTNAWIHHVTSLNSKNTHINVFSSKNITFEHVTLTAPDDSPNTDGVKMAHSSNIFVRDSVIATGDDCIALLPGSENINITGIACGPGHGISVGSLGGTPDELPVTTVTVRNCTFKDTQNGLRIKTRAPSHEGTVSDIIFEDITVNNVNQPIIIDQQYCPSNECGQELSRVQISNVRFSNIKGTSSSSVAVTLNCSSAVPCTGVELRDINLEYEGSGGKASSVCSNAKGVSSGVQNPASCLES